METFGKFGNFARLIDSADVSLCASCNQFSRFVPIRNLFRAVSRLGDGVVWYSIMAALPVIGGVEGLAITVRMAVTALAGLLVYKVMKSFSGRERPYVLHGDQVACAMPPLDRFSFPSGHTLHAVGFTAVLCMYMPAMLWILLPFSLLIALSRLVLGLHYPTDVLAGGCIGALIAWLGFELVPPM